MRLKIIKTIIGAILLLAFFLVGAHFHKDQIWPFGQGYYEVIKNIRKHGFNYKDKINEKPSNHIRTTAHYLKIDNYKKDFDHLAIKNEGNHIIELLAIKGNTGTNPNSFPPVDLCIYKVVLNQASKKISEQKIYTIPNNYRATDILITKDDRIFVSYVVRKSNNKIALRVDQILNQDDTLINSKIFESYPLEPNWGLQQTGGKMIMFDDDNILLGVGDFALWGYETTLPSNYEYIEKEYGKTIKINIKKRISEIFTSGHRNTQGLIFSSRLNMILETEHGPEGGDEINVILKNKNYGWPIVSYGMKYNQKPNEKQNIHFGQHEKYEKPLFTFIPSIGIKAIEEFNSNQSEFPKWKNNFIVCSNIGIYRIEIIKDPNVRLLLSERLGDYKSFGHIDKNNIANQCRDLVITKKGKIITNDFRVISNGSF